MAESSIASSNRFSSTLPVIVYTRLVGDPGADWRELDRGPGFFTVPVGEEGSVRIHNIDDPALAVLVGELEGCRSIAELNLAENRKITDGGMALLAALPQLTSLNLSSCSLTDTGLASLAKLTGLARLNLSYCNRITDLGVKKLRDLPGLSYLDLQGCVKVTNGGLSKIRKKNLVIHK